MSKDKMSISELVNEARSRSRRTRHNEDESLFLSKANRQDSLQDIKSPPCEQNVQDFLTDRKKVHRQPMTMNKFHVNKRYKNKKSKILFKSSSNFFLGKDKEPEVKQPMKEIEIQDTNEYLKRLRKKMTELDYGQTGSQKHVKTQPNYNQVMNIFDCTEHLDSKKKEKLEDSKQDNRQSLNTYEESVKTRDKFMLTRTLNALMIEKNKDSIILQKSPDSPVKGQSPEIVQNKQYIKKKRVKEEIQMNEFIYTPEKKPAQRQSKTKQ